MPNGYLIIYDRDDFSVAEIFHSSDTSLVPEDILLFLIPVERSCANTNCFMALSQIRFWMAIYKIFFVILDPVTSSITLYLDVESFSMAMAGV